MWAAASALALVAASQWLDTPRVEYLLIASIATVGAGALAWRRRPVPRRWGAATAAITATALVLGAFEQGTLREIENDWPGVERRMTGEAAALLATRMASVQEELQRVAVDALDAPADPVAAFARLELLSAAPEERAVILYRNGTPVAWGGRARVLPSLDPAEPAGVARIATSPFYLAVYVTARRDSLTAVAMTLVHAAPPADRFAPTLAGGVAQATGVRGFAFAPAAASNPSRDATARGAVVIGPAAAPLFEALPLAPAQGAAHLLHLEHARFRVGAVLVLALAVFVLAAWRAGRTLTWRAGALAVALGCTAVAPLNELSNLTRLFDSAVYFTPLGGPLTANAGALLLTSALVLLGLLAVVRRQRTRLGRPAAVLAIVVVAGLGPFLLRDLARGIQIPPNGVDAGLWLIWEIPLFLAAASVLLAGATAGGMALGRARGLPPATGPVLAGAAALLAPVVWQAPAGWPWWYTLVWVTAIATLTLARPSRAGVLAAAMVAAFGATTLVWANAARGRVMLAERELARLERPDPEVRALLTRFARTVADEPPEPSRQGLLQAFVASDLAAAGYPTLLAAWDSAGSDTLATLQTGVFPIEYDAVRRLAREAAADGVPHAGTIPAWPAVQVAVAVPRDGAVITAVLAPRTTLIAADPVASLVGTECGAIAESPYAIRLAAAREGGAPPRWRRDGYSIRGIVPVASAIGPVRAFVDVELRPLGALVQRGTLIVLIDLALVGILWTLTVVADGRFARWVRARRRRWRRSYRARLTLALFLFFVIPAAAFAVWSYQQLLEDGRQSRILLVRETLRAASRPVASPDWIDEESRRLDVPLLLYADGVLTTASEPLYEALAPTGLLLRPDVQLALGLGDEVAVSRTESGAAPLLFGYRALDAGADRELVLAAPARMGDAALDRRRNDLGILVLFATAAGALAALVLSGIAARQLATPVGALREAAFAIARGEHEPALEGEPPVEFRPVFTAFRQMAADLSTSRTELERAQQRTSAVLRNVASGVVAVGSNGRVTLANPRAEALLGASLPPGTMLGEVDTMGVAGIARDFIASGRDEQAFEVETPEVQLQGRVTRLGPDAAVLTIDDISAMARAQRVLAWGEMARQVAHEIKNPLTPIRLGVQHLRRAHGDPRVPFEKVLDQNVTRILEEIDRLDEIAKAFSRYGSAPAERTPAEAVDVAQVVRDLVALETMGEGALVFLVDGAAERVTAMAQSGELREVLLNLVENARLAEARTVHMSVDRAGDAVVIRVRDDGHGIPPAVLPRIFEPRFSTRTSGSGLGLAVSRRMVESWGGEIAVESREGEGTEVTVSLVPDGE